MKVLHGDATDPQGPGQKLILHVCNDIGGWGAGFVLALSHRWSEPEQAYHDWHRGKETPERRDPPFELGQVQFVPVTKEITVANMLAQHHVIGQGGKPPIRYDALRRCLERIAEYALQGGMSLHFPKFGAGLAGGDWQIIETMIAEILTDKGLSCTLYEYP